MDEFGSSCFDKKIYLVLFRLGSKVEDKTRPFDAPIVAAYLGFEGDTHNFQGLKNSTDDTAFVITTNHLNKKKKVHLTKSELKVKA